MLVQSKLHKLSIVDNKEKFGDVFTLHLDGPTVFLNSAEAVYDAFVKNADSFSNRPNTLVPDKFTVATFLGIEDSRLL